MADELIPVEEKKEHHLTRAKRLREEALLQGIESTESEETEEVEAPEPVKLKGRPYRVYSNRSALVAQVDSIEEAEEELKKFPGGSFQMI